MKITFITFHNWETKRIGGFHKLAEHCALQGNEVVFFSFERPYIIFFKKEERLNKEVLFKLSKGTSYIVRDSKGREGRILNCTWPTLRLPMPLYKYIPSAVNNWLNVHSFKQFSRFQKKYLNGTDVFVFESCSGVYLFDKIKEYNPKAAIVYRPSDPLLADKNDSYKVNAEIRVLLNCNYVFLVNKKGLELYKEVIPNFEKQIRYEILPNGVDTYLFRKKYPKPVELQKKNTALYVGALSPQWDLIIEAAQQCKDINFVIVCPEIPPASINDYNLPNLTIVPGIMPAEVPSWVTNCDLFIVPYPTKRYLVKPWGITAKYYQAMTACKPIVAYDDTDELRDYGVVVTHSYSDFINSIKSIIGKDKVIHYSLENKEWTDVAQRFINKIEKLTLEP